MLVPTNLHIYYIFILLYSPYYSGGSFITGQLGDKFSPVTVVGAGLIGSTVCLLLIAYGASSSIINNVALCSTWFLTCQMLHGAFQATGGPGSHLIINASCYLLFTNSINYI